MIVAAVAVAASFGIVWPGGKDGSRSPHIRSLPDGSALTLPDAEPRSARKADRDKKKKKPEREERRAVLVASDVRVLAPQGLVVRAAPDAPEKPTVPVDETIAVTPKPHRPPAPKPPVASVAKTPLPATAATQPVANRSTGLVRLSVQSVAVAPNAASKPELLVKMGIDGAQPGDGVPDTVTLHLLPQVPASVSKEDSKLALTARMDMVDAPRSAPTDPALRMRVRMTIAPVEAGTPMVQEPGPGDGKSNVIALTVSLDSFSDEPNGGTPDEPSDPEPPAPVDPEPGQPGSGGPTTPPPPAPADPEPGQPETGGPTPAPPAPVTPQPAPIPPVEVLLPVGPVRPNTETTTVPITPGTGDAAPPAESIPVDIVLEELPPDEPPPGAIPVDVMLEELPPDEPPADPADVPTPAAQEPTVDVPAAGDSDPESEPGTTPAGVDAAPDVSATAAAAP
ncbi:MAG TPA: hypothetical protein VHF51_14240 [Solirubrobacteraceae bacterium]|nr:hypothetical protein [Solirubrobacteraceae bacterium]